MKIKNERICCFEIRREINWANHNEDEVTISQERRLKSFTISGPVMLFVNADSAEDEILEYLNEIKSSCDTDILNLIKISIATPWPAHTKAKSDLSNLPTYGTEYYNLNEVE